MPGMSLALTPELLAACTGASLARARLWLPHISAAMARYGITTPARAAHFLAQIGHESGSLVYTREIWGPTPAQLRYEGRRDLGNTQPGDGRRHLGRGLIQITGRANYARAAAALGLPLIERPELLEQPAAAAMSAAWWWASRGLNELADGNDLRGITRAINGGYNGWSDRVRRFRAACIALGVPELTWVAL